jgi:aspartate carbamoyltransferase catalytic subunit
MLRVGGKAIGNADPRTSSASKGESLADTVRVASSYADILVLRHPRDGSARLAASYAGVPIINGGDGSHEHPTQTLCDLFTLKRKKTSLENLNVAISGDLKASRTIHSFVYALARFGANIVLKPAPGMELPPDGGLKTSSAEDVYRTGEQPKYGTQQLAGRYESAASTPSTSRVSRASDGPTRPANIRKWTPLSCGRNSSEARRSCILCPE